MKADPMTLDEIKRLRELERAARALIEEWDRFSGPEIWREDDIELGGGYYSPSGRMLGSDFVAALRRALPIETPPSHGEVEADSAREALSGTTVNAEAPPVASLTTNAGAVGLEAPAPVCDKCGETIAECNRRTMERLGMSDGWLPHTPGDPQPVADDVIVDVKLRGGMIGSARPAGKWRWGASATVKGSHGDIVAYRIVKGETNAE
jgi:hypothetical protein